MENDIKEWLQLIVAYTFYTGRESQLFQIINLFLPGVIIFI